MATVGSLVIRIGANIDNAVKGLNTLSQKLSDTGKKMQDMGKTLSMKLTAPIAAFGGLALRTAGDFESSMNRVGAISQATASQMQDLEKVARQLGATTQFSASQAADAMTFLAMAGFEVNEITEAMPSVLNLAAAAQLDMASAADIASNIMSGFNMTAQELEGAVDVLAKSFTSANTDLSQLGGAMKMVGPVASGFGIAFEEAAAAVGFLGDAGIQGTAAGTGLRRILTTLSKKSDELGVSVWDASGNMRSMADIFADLERKGLSSAKIMEIFGDRGGPAMQVLLSQGSEALREMTAELEDSGGTAERIAEQQMAGLNGAIKQLRSAFEELQIAISNSGLLEFATRLVGKIIGVIKSVSEWNSSTLKTITIIAGLVAAIGPLLFTLGTLTKAAGVAAIGVAKITVAVKALTLAMVANPFLAIGVALAGIATHLYIVNSRLARMKSAIEEILNLAPTGTREELDQVNQALADQAKLIERTKKEYRDYGLEGSDLEARALEPLLAKQDELIKKQQEVALAFHDAQNAQKQSGEVSRNVTDEMIGSYNAVTASIIRFKDAVRPEDTIFDPTFLGATRNSLQDINDIVRETGEISFDTSPFQDMDEDVRNLNVSFSAFGSMATQAFDRLVFMSEKFSNVLNSIARQLASRAIMAGLSMLVGGGGGLAAIGGFGGFLRSVIGVNDALITSGGDVVKFHPDDSILAMKDFSNLNTGGSQRVEVFGTIRGQDIFVSSERGQSTWVR